MNREFVFGRSVVTNVPIRESPLFQLRNTPENSSLLRFYRSTLDLNGISI